MGMYTSILIQGINEEEDLKQINEFLDKKMDRSYSPLVKITHPELGTWYYGEYNYFSQWTFAEFLETMDWKDPNPEDYVAMFVKDDEDFKYHEHNLKIPDQSWKNFGKNRGD